MSYPKSRAKDFSFSYFKCAMCGECCRTGYDIYVNREDVEKWKKLNKKKLLDFVVVNPKCISVNIETKLNSEIENIKKRINKQYDNFDWKIEELINFLKENHPYYSRSLLRQYIKTILPDIDYIRMIIPKSFNSILIGLEFGWEYIIKTDISGKCPYLDSNLCSIHDFKPIGCKMFPINKDNCFSN